MEKKTSMSTVLTRMRRVSASGALCTSLLLLAACSSGSSDNTVVADNNLDDETEVQAPANNSDGTAGDVVGTWVVCNDAGGLRFEYIFSNDTYINRVGSGNCAGFDSDGPLENAGSYAITGTTTSDSGLEAYTMELTTETIEGFPVFQDLIEKRYRLAYTGTADQLVFSNDTRDGEEVSLTLNFDTTFIRSR